MVAANGVYGHQVSPSQWNMGNWTFHSCWWYSFHCEFMRSWVPSCIYSKWTDVGHTSPLKLLSCDRLGNVRCLNVDILGSQAPQGADKARGLKPKSHKHTILPAANISNLPASKSMVNWSQISLNTAYCDPGSMVEIMSLNIMANKVFQSAWFRPVSPAEVILLVERQTYYTTRGMCRGLLVDRTMFRISVTTQVVEKTSVAWSAFRINFPESYQPCRRVTGAVAIWNCSGTVPERGWQVEEL